MPGDSASLPNPITYLSAYYVQGFMPQQDSDSSPICEHAQKKMKAKQNSLFILRYAADMDLKSPHEDGIEPIKMFAIFRTCFFKR